jgi:hypothetical protein
VFPGHCSHVLQPFDVSVAAPLKIAFKKAFLEVTFPSLEELLDSVPYIERKRTAAALRHAMVSAMIDAIEISCSRKNILSGFQASGISPCDPDQPLRNHFVPPERLSEFSNVRTIGTVNGLILTENESINNLYFTEFGQVLTNDNRPTLLQLSVYLSQGRKEDGIPITKLPDLLVEENGTLRRLKLN